MFISSNRSAKIIKNGRIAYNPIKNIYQFEAFIP